jgi:GNAT superfamily N-acetyltransferase
MRALHNPRSPALAHPWSPARPLAGASDLREDTQMAPQVTVAQLAHRELTPRLIAQIEAIFFETSGRTFEPGPERDAFRERWLGRYLAGGTDAVVLALRGRARVVGYLVGALDNPGEQARFADMAYFRTDFTDLCRRFPAHLHINLTADYRSQGIGARLIEVFAAHAARAGAPGMHVVAGSGMRNVRFYERCGFEPRGRALWNGREVVLLGRELAIG